ncbi:hypothetical protein D3880_16040 [Pseudomonas cavernae]|uniref:DUF4124 domain-containing protein n=1 Tax=Pseudomonas cavernae TaxID=2320867 RepID=A0A385Z727_9PSED|nr:DUF4124 domain-containing protein [Pseudomonas cavernae]AYC33773.1 hypothetical protein D3880_16040 [Pseudomonas cavernae]
MNKASWLAVLLLAGQAPAVWAATVLKCVDRNGNITFTQATCPPEQTLDAVMQPHNEAPSGSGEPVPLAKPRPPEPEPQEPPPLPPASTPSEQPVVQDEDRYQDDYDEGAEYYDPDYVHRPRPYRNHQRPYPPPYPHPLPPPHPVEPPRPQPKGVGAPRNALKHTGPQLEEEQMR